MNSFGTLLCGEASAEGTARSALSQLARSIDSFATRAIRFLEEDATEDTMAFGPFCARVLLENACAALVGRLDTFRMMYLSAFQAQPGYDHGRRANSAFSWTGDVIPREKPLARLWSLDHDLAKISRALFSQHKDHLYWRPAVEKMLDLTSSYPSDELTAELLTFDAETYISQAKGRSNQLYSTLSKSVHWEFFTNVIQFDEATVKNTIRDTCLLVAHLGLTSHFIPTAYGSLSTIDAMDRYLSFRRGLS